jgi:membrane associated rhomboid family serine protease
MSPRRLFRISACVILVALLWLRSFRTSQHLFGWSVALGATLAGVLLLLVMPRLERKWRRMRDEVPKKPLGLDT